MAPGLPRVAANDSNMDFIVFGKESEATESQLRKFFGSRYKKDVTVFQQSWIENRSKKNESEICLGIECYWN